MTAQVSQIASDVPARIDAGHARLLRLVTLAAVGTALILIAIKFAAWLETGSVSLLSSLIDSLLDAAASLINLFAVRQALRPATEEYRFGRGKAEALGALGQAGFITGSAIWLFVEAGLRLARPVPVEHSGVGIAVMVVAIVLTFALVVFQRRVIARTGSLAIGADSLHYTSDLIVNGSVIAALVLASDFGLPILDPIFAVGIAAFILFSAWRIAVQALHMLLDRELPEGDRDRIRRMALANPEVIAVHDMKTRASGRSVFIQLHIELNNAITLMRAHQISDAVEADLLAAFPQAEVIIHQDPAGIPERRDPFHDAAIS